MSILEMIKEFFGAVREVFRFRSVREERNARPDVIDNRRATADTAQHRANVREVTEALDPDLSEDARKKELDDIRRRISR